MRGESGNGENLVSEDGVIHFSEIYLIQVIDLMSEVQHF